MQKLGNTTLIAHTYKNVLATGLFSEVLVATDSDAIQSEIEKLGGLVFRSLKEHECGSDRIAEAVLNHHADVDQQNCALYFSRSPIPYYRSTDLPQNYYKHLGVYAFRREALLHFSASEMTPLEQAEKIECIRYLEQGKKMKMVVTHQSAIGIDTPEDLKKAEHFLNNPS